MFLLHGENVSDFRKTKEKATVGLATVSGLLYLVITGVSETVNEGSVCFWRPGTVV